MTTMTDTIHLLITLSPHSFASSVSIASEIHFYYSFSCHWLRSEAALTQWVELYKCLITIHLSPGTRLSVNAEMDIFTKMSKNVQIVQCHCHFQWTMSKILGQDATYILLFTLWWKHYLEFFLFSRNAEMLYISHWLSTWLINMANFTWHY